MEEREPEPWAISAELASQTRSIEYHSADYRGPDLAGHRGDDGVQVWNAPTAQNHPANKLP